MTEQERIRKKKYAEDHKDELKAYYAAYRLAHKEEAKKYAHDWNLANRDKKRDSARKWRRTQRESNILTFIRKRSKEKGYQFNLTTEDIVIPDVCPILGIPLFWTDGKATSNTPSIDRIDTAKGYVKGNVHIVSKLANSMKQDATLDQLILLGEWAKNMKNQTIN